MKKDSDEHIALIKEGLEVMRKAEENIKTDSGTFMVNYLMAVLLGRASDYMEPDERVGKSEWVPFSQPAGLIDQDSEQHWYMQNASEKALFAEKLCLIDFFHFLQKKRILTKTNYF